jgi:exopolysaccharide biosynthesis polyprenyl glycosylphosphotransferase
MTIPDYVQQAALHTYGRAEVGSASRQGGLSARASATTSLWALMDYLFAVLAGFVAFYIRAHAHSFSRQSGFFVEFLIDVPQISVIYVLIFGVYLLLFARIYGLYRAAEHRSALNEQRMTIQAVLTAGMLLCGTLYVMKAYAVSRIVVALMLLLTMSAMMLRRAIWRKVRERRFLEGRDVRNVLIVGDGRVAYALRNHLQSLPNMGFRFKGFVSVEPQAADQQSPEVVSGLENCVQVARSLFADEIYLTTPLGKDTVLEIVDEARANGIDVRVVPDLYDGLAWNSPVEFVGQFPTIPLHWRDFPEGAFLLKRVTDVIAGSFLLLLCAPIMLLIALAIKLTSDGPVFYRAERVGRKGRNFTCYKFRTMVAKADKMRQDLESRNERDGILFKISDDPRITGVGAWLRRYSLDELPQFLNVLAGDMSLVGPRPPLASEVERYDLSHLRRLDALPGMTGLWQVEARQDPSFDNYISLDTVYVENWSMMLDLRILARTVGVVLSGTGT